MRSPAAGAELNKATSRRAYLHPFKSFSTSRVPLRVEPSPEQEQKPKKESHGFFSQLRRSFTLSHGSSSAARSETGVATAAKTAAPASPWGRRVKNGLFKPLKIVKTSYEDCMVGIAEDPRVEGFAAMNFQHSNSQQAYAFQASASRHSQPEDAGRYSDAQLDALLRSRRHE